MSRKKVTVLDELNITGGGIYCILPYARLDKHKKALFKVGYAVDFRKRMESYLTNYPLGFYYVAFLMNPVANRYVREGRQRTHLTVKSYYYKIEQFVMKEIIKNGGKLFSSTARVKHLDEFKKGETEWFYTDQEALFSAFESANLTYGGIFRKYHLDDINKEANKAEKKKPNYLAEIIYPLTKFTG